VFRIFSIIWSTVTIWAKTIPRLAQVARCRSAAGTPFISLFAVPSLRKNTLKSRWAASRAVVSQLRVLLVGGPLEQELGGRGFALPRLQARLRALDASIVLGIVWGAWHIPLYFVPGTGQSETMAESVHGPRSLYGGAKFPNRFPGTLRPDNKPLRVAPGLT
jgi:membrane protease YdiL (CAAX protease family)